MQLAQSSAVGANGTDIPTRTRKGPSGRRFSDEGRNQEMIRLFRAGKTTPEIGVVFGIAASGVLGILRRYGIKRSEGGKEVAAALRKAEKALNKITLKFAALDITQDEFESLEQMAGALKKFKAQSKQASKRRIGWEFTFGQWWRFWQASGLWEQRGRSAADSAVMARRGDVGPYSLSNVYIITLADNFKESWATSPSRMSHRKGVKKIKGQFIHDPSVFSHALLSHTTTHNKVATR